MTMVDNFLTVILALDCVCWGFYVNNHNKVCSYQRFSYGIIILSISVLLYISSSELLVFIKLQLQLALVGGVWRCDQC